MPSPQLPQEAVDAAGQVVGPRVSAVGRTGGDGTLGQVGGLGTAGVTHGAVSTTQVADASGVHGDAAAVTQGSSVATESGMASAQINMLPQASQGTTHLQRILEVVLRALKRPDRRCTERQRSCRLGLRLLLVTG